MGYFGKATREFLSIRNNKLANDYNKATRALVPLLVGDTVAIQNHNLGKKQQRWVQTGRVVEVLPYRQYRIKMNGSGRVCLRNRRFLKPVNLPVQYRHPIPSSLQTNELDTSKEANLSPNALNENLPSSLPNLPPTNVTATTPKLPRALKELQSYNQPGVKEAPLGASRR